jgi:hypothetical protein
LLYRTMYPLAGYIKFSRLFSVLHNILHTPQLHRITKLVEENETVLLEAWHEFFNN